jgi:hypothetical protein
MGGALAGALGGEPRREWVAAVSSASRLDVEEPGRTMAEVAAELFARDAERHERRARTMAQLGAAEAPAPAAT